MKEYHAAKGRGEPVPTNCRVGKKPTELKVAFDCLLYYVGMLAFGQPIGTFEECVKLHYALYGLNLTDERVALLDTLRPMLIDGGIADLSYSELMSQLQALGWEQAYLKREVE